MTGSNPGQREAKAAANAKLDCPACSHALRLTFPLQERLWSCPNCKIRFTVAFDSAGHMATHIKLPNNEHSTFRSWNEVLGVGTGASIEQIKAAYRLLMNSLILTTLLTLAGIVPAGNDDSRGLGVAK